MSPAKVVRGGNLTESCGGLRSRDPVRMLLRGVRFRSLERTFFVNAPARSDSREARKRCTRSYMRGTPLLRTLQLVEIVRH
jgi:hypothetical protein